MRSFGPQTGAISTASSLRFIIIEALTIFKFPKRQNSWNILKSYSVFDLYLFYLQYNSIMLMIQSHSYFNTDCGIDALSL